MEKFGNIEIRVQGNKGNLKLSPDNYDVKEIIAMLQNIETGEIDKKTLKLLQLIDFKPRYDDDYLNSLIIKAKNNWKGVNPDEWLNNLRGGYDA